VTFSVDSESGDLSLAERSPGHSIGANGRRGREGVNDLSREGILFPRESGGTPQCSTKFLFSVAVGDTTSPSSKEITGSLLEKRRRQRPERQLRNVCHRCGTFRSGNGRPLGMH